MILKSQGYNSVHPFVFLLGFFAFMHETVWLCCKFHSKKRCRPVAVIVCRTCFRVTCLAGDLVLHVFEEQALLLRYELHLDGVTGQQVVQRLGQSEDVLLSWLHPQSSQVLQLSQLRFGQLCQANTQHQLLIFALFKINPDWKAIPSKRNPPDYSVCFASFSALWLVTMWHVIPLFLPVDVKSPEF